MAVRLPASPIGPAEAVLLGLLVLALLTRPGEAPSSLPAARVVPPASPGDAAGWLPGACPDPLPPLELLGAEFLPLPAPADRDLRPYRESRPLTCLEAPREWFGEADRGWPEDGVRLPDASRSTGDLFLAVELLDGDLADLPRIETDRGTVRAWPTPPFGADPEWLALRIPAAVRAAAGDPFRILPPARGQLGSWWLGRIVPGSGREDELEPLLARLDRQLWRMERRPDRVDRATTQALLAELDRRLEARPTPKAPLARVVRLDRALRLLVTRGELAERGAGRRLGYPGPLAERPLLSAFQLLLHQQNSGDGALVWLDASVAAPLAREAAEERTRSLPPELHPLARYVRDRGEMAASTPVWYPGTPEPEGRGTVRPLVDYSAMVRAIEDLDAAAAALLPPPGAAWRLRELAMALRQARPYPEAPALVDSLDRAPELRERLLATLRSLPAGFDRDRSLAWLER